MKKLLLVALLGVLAAPAQTPTQAELDRAVQYLQETRKGVEEATKGLSEAQWKFKAAADRWSVAEVVEHLALAEAFLMQLITERVMKAPAGAPDRNVKEIDAFVLATIPDRTNKAQAPGPLVPTGRWTPKEALDRFLQSRDKTIEFTKSTPDLREHVIDSAVGKPLDAYEWLLFIGAHSKRHTAQIKEVKADPNFPAK